MRRNVVNLLINITERKKQNVNSDWTSEAHVCNSALSLEGAFVYCIISIGARSGSTHTITERSHNFFWMCVLQVFLSEREKKLIQKSSLFIVWKYWGKSWGFCTAHALSLKMRWLSQSERFPIEIAESCPKGWGFGQSWGKKGGEEKLMYIYSKSPTS